MEKNMGKITEKWKGNCSLLSDFIVIPEIFKLLPKSIKGKLIYDAGCGVGRVAKLLAKKGANVIAVDISSKNIKFAKREIKNRNIVFKVGDIRKINSLGKKVDIIVCCLVLHLLNNKDITVVLRNFSNILKKKGILIIVVPNPEIYYWHPPNQFFKFYKKEWRDNRKTKLKLFFLDRTSIIIEEYFHTWECYINKISKFFKISKVSTPTIKSNLLNIRIKSKEEKRIPFFILFKAIKL